MLNKVIGKIKGKGKKRKWSHDMPIECRSTLEFTLVSSVKMDILIMVAIFLANHLGVMDFRFIESVSVLLAKAFAISVYGIFSKEVKKLYVNKVLVKLILASVAVIPLLVALVNLMTGVIDVWTYLLLTWVYVFPWGMLWYTAREWYTGKKWF